MSSLILDTLPTEQIMLAEALELRPLLERGQWLTCLEKLMPTLYPNTPSEPPQLKAAQDLRDTLLAALRHTVETSKAPPQTRMKFGTSGWRGLLAHDFTIHNVACVTQGLVDVLMRPELHPVLGVKDVAELRSRGCVLAHDTRMLGPEFAETAARVLLAHDIKVMLLGMATTPEVSAAIAETHAAFSINFTPSHNPFTYHGYKFNPADGGPAPATLTGPVAQRANELLASGSGYTQLSREQYQEAQQDPTRFQCLDPITLYKASLTRRFPWLKLEHLVEEINHRGLALYIDNGFGATTGKYERLLEGIRPELLHVYHSQPDPLFGGANREPSVPNFRQLQARMQSDPAKLIVGVMNDGDGDRFVGGGRNAVLVMNKYGAMVVRYLARRLGLQGDVARSVMTSHMADLAQQIYLPHGKLHVTAVGFQYLRDAIPSSVNAWEESDGMSPMGWSLDKDGLIAALLLIQMVLNADQTAEQLLAQTEEELGSFYFERRKVSGRLSGETLTHALHTCVEHMQVGTSLTLHDKTFVIEQRLTMDGIKIILNNGWWFGLRASGTEPVVRPYVETFTLPGASEAARQEAALWQVRLSDWLEKLVAAAIQ